MTPTGDLEETTMKPKSLRAKIEGICRDFRTGRTFYSSEAKMVEAIEEEIQCWEVGVPAEKGGEE